MTRYGLPQVAVFPAIIMTVMVGWFLLSRRTACECSCPARSFLAIWLPEVILLIVLVWVFSFFRDPNRAIVQDANLLLSPADGTVAVVETLDSYPGFDGPVLRVEIFLSIFNVHINRTPCASKIGTVTYKPGKFLDARSSKCSKLNEANEIEMFRTDEPKDRLLVRQISGAIARRIVCEAKTDQALAGGEKFGMIKFGSCTELFVPVRDSLECTATVGDKVKAGLTILARYSQKNHE